MVKPDAILFTAIAESSTDHDDSDTDSADEDDTLPLTVPCLLDSLDTSDTASLLDQLLFHCPSDDQLRRLTECTVGQTKNPLWAAHRMGRITASHAKTVMAFSSSSSAIPASVVSAICVGSSHFLGAAMQWGIEHEKEAIELFTAQFAAEHVDGTVQASGLFICKDLFILGASPDATTNCKCCGVGVVEVKCPYKYRECDVEGLLMATATDRNFCLDSNLTLKQNHKYYAQVQCQMGVTATERCEFVLYTTKTVLRTTVDFDGDFFDRLKIKCVEFFSACILPKLRDMAQ